MATGPLEAAGLYPRQAALGTSWQHPLETETDDNHRLCWHRQSGHTDRTPSPLPGCHVCCTVVQICPLETRGGALPSRVGCDAGEWPHPGSHGQQAHWPLQCNEVRLGHGTNSVGSLHGAGAEVGLTRASMPNAAAGSSRGPDVHARAHAEPEGRPGAWSQAGSKTRKCTFLLILVLFE